MYRALGLGDFLTAVPAYRAVRRAHPRAELTLAAPGPLRPLAALTGSVDVFLPTAELQTPAWAGDPPDVVVNLHGSGPQSHRALLPLVDGAASGRLVAYARPEVGVDGPPWRADEHEVARWCRLVGKAGMPAFPHDLDLAVPAPQPVGRGAPVLRGATVVHPGAADPARRWPPDRLAVVAKQLSADGHSVVVTGVPDEVRIAEQVARAAGLRHAAVLAGQLDLAGMAALVAAARLVLCGDTGIAHLATAYRVPSVVLFGAMSPALWGPPADRAHHVVLRHAELADAPGRAGQPHPALDAIGVNEVLAAISLAEAGDRRGDGP